MGCGSSKAAVAVIDNNDKPQSSTIHEKKSERPKKTQSLEHFQVKSSKTSLKKNSTQINTINNENRPPSTTSSVTSLIDLNNNNNTKNNNIRQNGSKQSLRDEIRKPSTASSAKSGDSGVYDEGDRLSSAKSRKSNSSVNSKPPSGKKTSARQRLLRIDDQALDQSKNDSQKVDSNINMVSRPKTRLGNVAFDLMIDAPETGNMKKKPDRLPALENKRKRSKKVKTKEEIEKKMKEVEERRKLQELEKQMKAKQFQHLAVHTTVQPFTMEEENEETVQETKDLVV